MVCPLPAPSPRPPPNLLLYISAVTLLYLCNKEFSGFRSISLRSWCSGTWSVLHPLIPAHRALQTCVRTAGVGGQAHFLDGGHGSRDPTCPDREPRAMGAFPARNAPVPRWVPVAGPGLSPGVVGWDSR